jgi:hypothetical protein
VLCKLSHFLVDQLLTITPATASFGAPLSWKQDPKESRAAGHEMSFVEAISEVSENIFWLLAMPEVR